MLRATRVLVTRRGSRLYHDESFGYRKPTSFSFPDYTPEQLKNRANNAALLRYVDSMRMHGHRAASIDPLNLLQRDKVEALRPQRYGLNDPERMYPIDGIIWLDPAGPTTSISESWSLQEIVNHMEDIYVNNIAVEYMHSASKAERQWFAHLLESRAIPKKRSPEEKKRLWELMAKSEVFDHFLQLKFPNLKRYGLEGGESMLPAIDSLFSVAAAAGIEHIMLAMPHRGRLNLLCDLLQYPPAALFHKIKGGSEIPEEFGCAGDVISHLVSGPTLRYGENSVKVAMMPNPSHLEAANPVALGKTRAKQYSLIHTADPACELGDKVMCVQLHGDASFTGQGVIMEGLGLSNLPHYTTGGSVHLVVNNSIGYTTPAAGSRSSFYCSDIGKMINAPVLHVNGDHPEDVARAMEIAFKYRNTFRKDIIVDLIVYRKWGHNELDEPAYTQPLMYKIIRKRDSPPVLYEERLMDQNVITQDSAATLRQSHKSYLTNELEKSSTYVPTFDPVNRGNWGSMSPSAYSTHDPATGADASLLKSVGEASVETPEGFEIHPRLKRHVGARKKSLESGTGIDWATGEALAFGSLLMEGYDIRISGQDVGRGTFSQRHAMLVDQKTEKVIVPFNANLKTESRVELANSSLSEMAVLGFEFGMSLETPKLLPIWEAQFGDFFNGAQIIIDTFVSSAWTKWMRQSGLVMLLPHGLDGAGPEHSSMRMERFLQLTNDPHTSGKTQDVNMHVVYPTTPAQYFHLLRRQMHRDYRKPLIVAAPKGLLRLPAATSTLSQFETGTRFSPVLAETEGVEGVSSSPTQNRVIFLAGKLYYDLTKERSARGLDSSSVSFIRIEELSPFPFEAVRTLLESDQFKDAQEVCWIQEEPRNQGAWPHVGPRLQTVLDAGGDRKVVRYLGRAEDAVPAPGIGAMYKLQQAAVIDSAFNGL